jgi:NhaA family Na+:H+ antiporter
MTMKIKRLPPTPVEKILQPFQEFLHRETSSGIVLLICTVIALFWANSPWNNTYHAIWQIKLTVGLDNFSLSKPLWLWINDGLMAIFFFVVGLEIKRELLTGELASVRKAILPAAAALGGMVVPAGIYFAFNVGGYGANGWGIPMATDIAFALGVLTLLGQRIPLSLKVFLTALAIVDDLGAVLVIAIFYTDTIVWGNLAIAGGFLILLIIANRLSIRHPFVYAILGLFLWTAFLKSGVHATIAGVILAMTIPSKAPIDSAQFIVNCRTLLNDFERHDDHPTNINDTQRGILQALETTCERTSAPLQRMEHTLHPWISFLIMPVFALANAGITLEGNILDSLMTPVSWGIIAGLIVGKQLGITLSVWLAVKKGWADLPNGITFKHIYGASCLAGIGFTMSLFVTGLAFQDPALVVSAKLAILVASLCAGWIGWITLRSTSHQKVETV